MRIGLAGGGTDLIDFFNINGGQVLNSTIKKYAFSELDFSVKNFTAESNDYNKKITFSGIDFKNEKKVPKELKLQIAVYKKIIKLFNQDKMINCKLSTSCDAPIGSGLGSSSTLVVAMIKVFDEALNLGLDNYMISELAYEIERIDCNLKGGKQDQYAASFGGLNFIEFEKKNTIVNNIKIKDWFKWELESSLILHFCGLSRCSSDVIEEQSNLNNSNKYLKLLKKEANIMKDGFLRCDLNIIKDSLNKSWALKSKSSKKVTNKIIEDRIKFGFKNGAEAAKISGAGGGGFILFMTNPSQSVKLLNKLREKSSETFFCNFSDKGVQSWSLSY